MKYLISAILIGLLLAGITQAIRFDWSLGQPAEILNNETTGTTTDRVDWSLGQPVPMASSTPTGGEAVVPTAPTGKFQCISGGQCIIIGNVEIK